MTFSGIVSHPKYENLTTVGLTLVWFLVCQWCEFSHENVNSPVSLTPSIVEFITKTKTHKIQDLTTKNTHTWTQNLSILKIHTFTRNLSIDRTHPITINLSSTINPPRSNDFTNFQNTPRKDIVWSCGLIHPPNDLSL